MACIVAQDLHQPKESFLSVPFSRDNDIIKYLNLEWIFIKNTLSVWYESYTDRLFSL